MVLVVAVTLYPFYYMLIVSVSDQAHVLKGEISVWPKGINLEMYDYVVKDGRIFNGYKNTLIYVTLGTCISLVITSMGAYALSKKTMVFAKTFMFLIIVTMFIQGGMIPTFLVVKQLGLVNTMWAMVLPGAIATWNLIIMRTFFSNIPKELEESGKLDGLSDVGIFVKIVVPLSKAVFATIGLFYAVQIWNNYMGPLIYLRNADLFPLQVMLREIVLAGQLTGSEGAVTDNYIMAEDSLKYATVMMSTLPILIIYPFLQKHFVKGAMIGSVKG
ncbi:carbohydrate ABC transporter permease [Paenibacillus thalictri]|uniref:Carbohydrate ABC transporter permease n=2 Tax=Paenibacillus thalictri TaxID=2527873 RepID=A0A4Q9DXW3_9BACL|nr:carbohydrate ABC transporter permease [Paenibacillus thalictri]